MSSIIQARCEGAVSEVGGVKVFTMRVQNASAEFLNSLQPGRYVAIHYPDTFGELQQRIYSITRKQGRDLFEIAVKRSNYGGVSDHLHSTLHEDGVMSLQYVAGDISVESIAHHQRIGMVAGGIGITLPLALLRELAVRADIGQPVPDVVLLLSVPKIADIPFLYELLQLALTTTWFTFRVFITQESVQPSDHFAPGRLSADSLKVLEQPQAVVICGSHSFADTFREHAAAEFPSARLLIEAFTSPASAMLPERQHEEAGQTVKLRIADSEQTIESPLGKSLLEILESSGIPIRSQCRAGICGNCRVRVSEGECRFESDFCLSDEDKNAGYALACCTFPLSGNLTVSLGLAG
ncbi:2Fe-2S iron-sulfur cluster-binding protein [Serratia sp. D1N4]